MERANPQNYQLENQYPCTFPRTFSFLKYNKIADGQIIMQPPVCWSKPIYYNFQESIIPIDQEPSFLLKNSLDNGSILPS